MGDRVLIIDDDRPLTEVLQLALEEAGYQVQVATNGLEGLQRLYQWHPHLVILDIMMPKMDGWETCRRIREVSQVPVLMLTAKGGDSNELRGLLEGADLYMTKPFTIPLLIGRIRALLRRSRLPGEPAQERQVTVGNLRIDLDKHQVTLKGRPVELSPTEYQLLSILAASPGKVVPHRELLSKVWGKEYSGEDLYLKLYIWYLRKKIEPDPSSPTYIITKRGVGYFLNDRPTPDDGNPIESRGQETGTLTSFIPSAYGTQTC